MPLVKIYCEKLLYSPLEFSEYVKKLEAKNYRFIKSVVKSNIIMSSFLNVLKKHAKNYGNKKKYLLWTHEPYHDFTLESKIKTKNNVGINIMNVYTGDVFTNNYRYFYFDKLLENYSGFESKLEKINEPVFTINPIGISSNISYNSDFKKLMKRENIISKLVDNPRPIVALSTYYNNSYYKNNPHTLLPVRYVLINYGYQNGFLDVYGKGWENHDPKIKPVENSRNKGDRRETKDEILQNYLFNLCLENVDYPYYITEKIWEPIKNYCLPIYYSNTTIYQTFPENSFIDYKNFESPEDLYSYLKKMTKEEYMIRMNRCIDGFNSVISGGNNNTWKGKSDNKNINYLEYKTCFEKLSNKLNKI